MHPLHRLSCIQIISFPINGTGMFREVVDTLLIKIVTIATDLIHIMMFPMIHLTINQINGNVALSAVSGSENCAMERQSLHPSAS